MADAQYHSASAINAEKATPIMAAIIGEAINHLAVHDEHRETLHGLRDACVLYIRLLGQPLQAGFAITDGEHAAKTFVRLAIALAIRNQQPSRLVLRREEAGVDHHVRADS